jgi:hypothetical protein
VCAPTERARKENYSDVLALECEEGYRKRRPYNRHHFHGVSSSTEARRNVCG